MGVQQRWSPCPEGFRISAGRRFGAALSRGAVGLLNVKLLRRMAAQTFFRWVPTTIILWLFGGLFTFAAVVCAWQASAGSISVSMVGDAQHTARWFLRGAMADALAAVGCILGWELMRRQRRETLAIGASLVMVATFIIAHRSLIYLFRGAGFAYWYDLLLEPPFLIYAIIYGFRTCLRTNS